MKGAKCRGGRCPTHKCGCAQLAAAQRKLSSGFSLSLCWALHCSAICHHHRQPCSGGPLVPNSFKLPHEGQGAMVRAAPAGPRPEGLSLGQAGRGPGGAATRRAAPAFEVAAP